MKDGYAYVDDMNITKTFGRRHPGLFHPDNGFADIAHVKKTRQSIIVKRPNVGIVPIPGPPTRPSNLKFRFYKIF